MSLVMIRGCSFSPHDIIEVNRTETKKDKTHVTKKILKLMFDCQDAHFSYVQRC